MGRLRVAAALVSSFLVLIGVAAAAVPPSGPPTSIGTGGAAASVETLATQAAIDELKAGGNAVDAAVVAAGVLGVTEPFSCGIGGGGFMVIRTASGKVTTIDGREKANSVRDWFDDIPSSTALYLDPDGFPHKPGTVFKNPDLATAYERIAHLGLKGFYRGAIADAMTAMVQNPVIFPNANHTWRPGLM